MLPRASRLAVRPRPGTPWLRPGRPSRRRGTMGPADVAQRSSSQGRAWRQPRGRRPRLRLQQILQYRSPSRAAELRAKGARGTPSSQVAGPRRHPNTVQLRPGAGGARLRWLPASASYPARMAQLRCGVERASRVDRASTSGPTLEWRNVCPVERRVGRAFERASRDISGHWGQAALVNRPDAPESGAAGLLREVLPGRCARAGTSGVPVY